MNYNDEEETRDEDRLSSLPDPILINILSLLPTKTAVATSVLSPRWRGLWTQIDSLEFYFLKFRIDIHTLTTICQVMNQITSAKIYKFTLHLKIQNLYRYEELVPFPGLIPCLESWLHHICARNVEHININLTERWYLSESFLNLPRSVLQTCSLVVLEMVNHVLPCKLPTYDDDDDDEGDEIINLPNLKKLSICLHQCSPCKTLAKLIRSCPSLEDLSFSIESELDCPQVQELDILSQSLKKLDIGTFLHSNVVKVTINAPKLVKLKAQEDYPPKIMFVTKPFELLEAVVDYSSSLEYFPVGPEDTLIEGISSVRSLEVDRCVGFSSLVRFPNLTHLKWIMLIFIGFKQLMASLESCPVLKVLILKLLSCKEENNWTPPCAPVCALIHVKRIEIDIVGTISYENFLVAVEYLLSNAQAMEQLVICNNNSLQLLYDQVECDREMQLCEQIYKLPRSLLLCQIVFSGKYYKARVRNGQMLMLWRWKELHKIQD